MLMPLFKPISCTVEWLVSNIDHGSLGLPDIQRPFVWNNRQVRDLFDSMFRGYPVGFLLFWAASVNQGSRQIGSIGHGTDTPALLIIDGQQRLTSLYAVMKGKPILDKNFAERPIKIAFHPEKGIFEVHTAALARSPEWIPNISDLFTQPGSSRKHINAFLERLEAAQGEIASTREEIIAENIEQLLNVKGYSFSALEIDKDTDEELVSDIFVRVNSGGQKLNQSDFILTLMSVFWDEGRNTLETFCKLSRIPSDHEATPYNYFTKPEPGDMLRVSVGLAFKRARLKYGYQVLRGKNLETGEVTAALREAQFDSFKAAQAKVLDLQNWKDFLRCLYTAGFRSEKMITSGTGLMYAYTFYLIGKYDYALSGDTLRLAIARWFFMTSLTARYSSSPESKMEEDLADLRGIQTGQDFLAHLDHVIRDTLTDDFWNITLVNDLAKAAARSPSLFAYYAALVLLDARVLFSDLKVADMLDQAMRGDREALERHHLFPKAHLARIGISDDRDRNQIANYALVEWDRNTAIADDSPAEYFPAQQAKWANNPNLRKDLRLHALPEGWECMEYGAFLEKRRRLMAQIIRDGFTKLLR
ncbi:MAG: DUF262 domain-containing protein [Desulfobulbus sp.]|nr:DUF262 domain-containing protein [Desulfobulbus sp.]